MKNLLLSLTILFITAATAFAQDKQYRLTPDQEEKCTELTRSMVNELRLNELGYIKLKALNRERIALAEAAKENLYNDPEAREQLLNQIEADFDQKLVAILDANQLQAYAAYKKHSTLNLIATLEEK